MTLVAPAPAGDRADLTRIARIISAVAVAGPLISELLHPWIVRYPAIGAVAALAEHLWTVYTRSRATAGGAPIPRPTSPPDDPFWP